MKLIEVYEFTEVQDMLGLGEKPLRFCVSVSNMVSEQRKKSIFIIAIRLLDKVSK